MQSVRIDERLIAALYDTALYGSDWQPALERFRAILNSAEASLCDWRDGVGDAQVDTSGHLLTPEVREPYFRYYGRIDPKLKILGRNRPDYLFNDARHFDPGFVARDPFYQEYTKSLGMRHTLDMVLERTGRSKVFLAVMRGAPQGPYDPRTETVFRQCSRHFLRVVKLREKIDGAQRVGTLSFDALDALRLGVMVLGRDARVMLSNRAAEDFCASGAELQMRDGKLTARSPKFAQRLERATGDAIDRGVASGLRPDSAASEDRSIWIAPLPAERNLAGCPAALILIGEAAQRGPLSAGDLSVIYGLTAAEAELAILIGNGASLSEAAGKRGVRLSTVRSQMLAVLQKTGARRQADLVRMLARLPGAMLRKNQSDGPRVKP